jgi:acyl-CoA synthetase (AMP-forming)/AMP-acid ligase II
VNTEAVNTDADAAGARGMSAENSAVGPAFVQRLRSHGDRPALSVGDGWLSYRDVADRVEETATRIGTGRCLVLVEAANELGSLVGYLAALHGGHVALLANHADAPQIAELIDRFDPDVVIDTAGQVRDRRTGSRHRLHPDLALLLTTSGSTGTPRLVRLSSAALDANAAAIATYLEITGDDRAALTLPMHYCYGLSVINSNLLAGAGVLLSDASVADPAFWTAMEEQAVTSLHGVPYTFELLDRAGFADMALPHLRYVTQAGGRLAPEQVRRWASVGAQRGWRLFVMYGQTEATARMAYLPPELAAACPSAVGIAIPGGELSIEPVDHDSGDGDGVGELVYRGPNVMLGYADGPADLAEGRTADVLRTGDLGRRRPDGLFEIVGRRARFVKPFGIRTDLDRLEHLLAEHSIEAACTGTDARIRVAAHATTTIASTVATADVATRVRTIVTERLALPASVLTVVAVKDLPRGPNGKLDHPAVARLVERRPSLIRRAAQAAGSKLRQHRSRPETVRAVFARTFPGQDLPDDASFIDLGGDSLTYVQVAADIERVLGTLPPGWDHRPRGELEAMTVAARPTGRATIETAVLVRAVAILFVVGEHAHLWAIVGGAHLLLALSGWTFARFILTRDAATSRSTNGSLPIRTLRSTLRIAIPSAVWIAFRALLHNVRFVDILLVGSLLPPLVPGYWFVDALVQILVLLALLFTLPALRHLESRHPFGFAATVLSLALLGRFYPTAYGWWFTVDLYSTQTVLWLFVLGWMTHRAVTTTQRWMTVAATLVLVPTFFGADALRSVIVVGGLLLLLFRPTFTVPRIVATVATTVASASLGIYLTHFGVLPLSKFGFPPEVVVAIAIAVGIGSSWILETLLRQVARWRRDRGTPAVASASATSSGESVREGQGVVLVAPGFPNSANDHPLAA